MTSKTTQSVLKGSALALATVGVPVASSAGNVLDGMSLAQKALLITSYELLVLAGSFVVSVGSIIRDRAIERTAARLDSAFLRALSGFTSYYKRQVIATNTFMDTKGLNTRGPYVLGLEQVYVELAVVPSEPTNVANDPLYEPLMGPTEVETKPIWSWISETESRSNAIAIIGPQAQAKPPF